MLSSQTSRFLRGNPKLTAWSCVACGIIHLLLATLAGVANAQSGPGWVNAPLKQVAMPTSTANPAKPMVKAAPAQKPATAKAQNAPAQGGAALLAASAYVAPDTAPDFISPEITDLATNLQNDPLRIFNWVRNHIEFVHYYGCKKGAALTLLEGSGNDADQSALLVALLRAAGHQAQYVRGVSYHPYASSAGVSGLGDWLQVEEGALGGFLFSRGTPQAPADAWWDTGFGMYAWRRYWVQLDGSIALDPSQKKYLKLPTANIAAMSGYSRANLLAAAAGTVSGASVSGLNEAAMGTELAARTSAFLAAYAAQSPNASPTEVMGGLQLIPQDFTNLNQGYPSGISVTEALADSLPDALCSTLRLQIGASIDVTLKTAQLRGRKLSLTFENNQAVLRLDDADPAVAREVGGIPGTNVSLTMTMTHANNVNNQTGTASDYRRWGSYVLLYGFDVSDQWVRARQDKLENLRRTLAGTTPQVKTETLNVMGLSWFRQTHLERLIFATIDNDSHTMAHRFGRMADEFNGTTGGYYVDVAYDYSMILPRDAARYFANGHFDAITTGTLVASAMEHGVLEQMQSTPTAPVKRLAGRAECDLSGGFIELDRRGQCPRTAHPILSQRPDHIGCENRRRCEDSASQGRDSRSATGSTRGAEMEGLRLYERGEQ